MTESFSLSLCYTGANLRGCDLTSHIGEVLETSTQEFCAESYSLDAPPALGCLVKTGPPGAESYAVVFDIETVGVDPSRPPIARGRGLDSPEEVYRQNPQLERLFRTLFRALAVGHREDGRIRHYLPPRPAPVHSFVHTCSEEEVREFTASLDFLGLLLSAPGIGLPDEVTGACLRQAAAAQSEPRDFLVRAGKELASLMSNDLKRLDGLLRRITP